MMTIPTDPLTSRRLRSLVDKPPGTLVIHEIYRSLQGEGTHGGLPCTFIRLTACHLRCVYCDTPHAFHSGEAMSIDAVVATALGFGDNLVEVTGGEPLLQPEVFELMTRLADAGRTVLLETSGSLDIATVDPRVRIILDLKTPESGESDANLWGNLELLKSSDELKIVVCNREDFDWAVERLREYNVIDRCPVLVAPAQDGLKASELASWILESRLTLRLQVQLHKILWGADTRGV